MKHLILGLACLILAACQNGKGVSFTDISNDIGLACNAAQQLLALPSTQAGLAAGAGKIALSAAKLSGKVSTYCTGVQLAGPIVAAALDQLNTAGAVLLGTGVAKRS